MLHDHWPVGIRTQLMLWYLMAFAVLMLLFGGIFYANLRTSLSASLDTALQLRTQQIASGITDEQGKIIIQDVTGELPGVVDRDSVQGTDGQSGETVGPGIGLYFCQTIIERHRGQVGVQSAPGKGSVFWFTLPLAGQDHTAEDAL